jgi:hypothetical protein
MSIYYDTHNLWFSGYPREILFDILELHKMRL